MLTGKSVADTFMAPASSSLTRLTTNSPPPAVFPPRPSSPAMLRAVSLGVPSERSPGEKATSAGSLPSALKKL